MMMEVLMMTVVMVVVMMEVLMVVVEAMIMCGETGDVGWGGDIEW